MQGSSKEYARILQGIRKDLARHTQGIRQIPCMHLKKKTVKTYMHDHAVKWWHMYACVGHLTSAFLASNKDCATWSCTRNGHVRSFIVGINDGVWLVESGQLTVVNPCALCNPQSSKPAFMVNPWQHMVIYMLILKSGYLDKLDYPYWWINDQNFYIVKLDCPHSWIND